MLFDSTTGNAFLQYGEKAAAHGTCNSEYSVTLLVPLCLLIYSISIFTVIYCLFRQDFTNYKIQIFIRISNIVKDIENH